MVKKIGKNYLKNFTFPTNTLKEFSEHQNSAESTGTATQIQPLRRVLGLEKRIPSYWKAFWS